MPLCTMINTEKTCQREAEAQYSMHKLPMKCGSMVSIALFGPGVPGSNPGWFFVSNSDQKMSFHE